MVKPLPGENNSLMVMVT